MPNCTTLMRDFIKKRCTLSGKSDRTVRYFQGQYWKWDGISTYHPMSPREFRHMIVRYLMAQGEGDFSNSTRTNLIYCAEAKIDEEKPPTMPMWVAPINKAERSHAWIAFRNGLLDLTAAAESKEPELVPGNPRWFSRHCFPYWYEPDARCPVFMDSLHDWLNDDQQTIDFLQEFVGYCLTPDTRRHTGLFLEGEGANGKGVFCGAIQNLLGPVNFSGVPLEKWGNDFAMEPMYDKLVNFATETQSTSKGKKLSLPTTLLKSVISDDPITVNRKGISMVTVNVSARQIISWNQRPQVGDDSDGFWRRLRLVCFPNQYLGQNQDPFLGDKIAAERAGLMNWAIEGAIRLTRNGRFTDSKKLTLAEQDYRDEDDPIRAFAKSRIKAAPTSAISKSVLYNQYVYFCLDHSLDAVNESVFFKRLKKLFPNTRTVRLTGTRNRYRAIRGVKIVGPIRKD